MLFGSEGDRQAAEAIGRLAHCNPFLRERIDAEQAALGNDFDDSTFVWNVTQDWEGNRPNIGRLKLLTEKLLVTARQRLLENDGRASQEELSLYEDLVAYLLYYRVQQPLESFGEEQLNEPREKVTRVYNEFLEGLQHFVSIPGLQLPSRYDPAHLFACYFQVRRAFHFIFRNIVGASMPTARLRAAIWQSIFTHDMRRYRQVLYDRMGDLTTLIIGASGTGKELVARAIAMARYIPFDHKTRSFKEDFAQGFFPLNLSALSPTLIESELFGHRRGAFTGALEDRIGWLEVCPPAGAVFLDEIGELDPAIQVKLLRVLHSRQFQRLGDTKSRPFRGKIIAATNRDLPGEIAAGRFRRDFYYRICSDIIRTPALQEQLRESVGDLRSMIHFIARRISAELADALAEEVEVWVVKHLGRNYAWPGNFRELEQCVRNVLVRNEYLPLSIPEPEAPSQRLAAQFEAGAITADQLLRRYCSLVYARNRNLKQTARLLGLDRRTVRAKVDPELLAEPP
jgi:transcriptional regulator with AAA-type ATPase domain